jgi:hypothetical protein
MRTSSRRLTLALVVSLALIAAVPIANAASAAQTLSFAGGDFNSCLPTQANLEPVALPSWTAVIFTAHQFFNSSSTLDFEFLSSSDNAALAPTGGSSCLSWSQSTGWFQWLRVQLSENGNVYVAYLQNSTSGNPIVLYNSPNSWLSNGTSAGTLTTNHESAINYGQEVFVNVQDGQLFVGTLSSTGAISYLVNGFGLTSEGLGGTNGLTAVGAASGAFASSSQVVAGAYSGNGYAQVEIDPTGFTNTQAVTTTTNTILEVVPLIVIVAVIGMVVGMLKKFKL